MGIRTTRPGAGRAAVSRGWMTGCIWAGIGQRLIGPVLMLLRIRVVVGVRTRLKMCLGPAFDGQASSSGLEGGQLGRPALFFFLGLVALNLDDPGGVIPS